MLRDGGSYVCITPSRVNGPHDCSAQFEDIPCPVREGDYHANGLHLKEYTTRELMVLFRRRRFRRLPKLDRHTRALCQGAPVGHERDGNRPRA